MNLKFDKRSVYIRFTFAYIRLIRCNLFQTVQSALGGLGSGLPSSFPECHNPAFEFFGFIQLFGTRFNVRLFFGTVRLCFGTTSASAQSPAQCFLIMKKCFLFSQFLSMTALSLLLARTFPFNGSIIVVITRVFFRLKVHPDLYNEFNWSQVQETRNRPLNTGTKTVSFSPVTLSGQFSSCRQLISIGSSVVGIRDKARTRVNSLTNFSVGSLQNRSTGHLTNKMHSGRRSLSIKRVNRQLAQPGSQVNSPGRLISLIARRR